MPKIKNLSNQSFIDCEDIEIFSAIYEFDDNTLKQGKVNLNSKQFERVSLLLTHNLKTIA